MCEWLCLNLQTCKTKQENDTLKGKSVNFCCTERSQASHGKSIHYTFLKSEKNLYIEASSLTPGAR